MTDEDIKAIKTRLANRFSSPQQEALFVDCAPLDIAALLEYVEGLESDVSKLRSEIEDLQAENEEL